VQELRRHPNTIVVLEDLHWADEATLDVVRLLARRIETLPALVVATFRDDELDRSHPLRIVVGELPAGGAVDRLAIARLSAGAVAALAAMHGVDAAELHRRTAGNPFFVTEVLAAGGSEVPDTVRDAVLARAARLGGAARSVLEAVAIVPQRAELWLLEAVAGDDLGGLEACVASGMLRSEGDAVAFRHEIARIAIEDTLPPDRRVHLHRAALASLSAAPGRARDLARLAHHADAAGDTEAVLRHAPAAGEQAAALGAHREAAAQFERALRFADDLPSERRAELLERCAYECYLTDRVADAIDARRRALEEHRRAGNRLREGDTRRWLSRLAWFAGDKATAEDEARRAVELLEALEPGAELAMAYSNVAHLGMLADDGAEALRWGTRAIELAERLGETEILAHALNNVGSAEMRVSIDDGTAKLRRSLDLALEAGLEEHVARAYTNLGAIAVKVREYGLADRWLDAGLAYSRERDLDAWLLYMSGWKARSHLDQGRWDAAADAAGIVLRRPDVAVPTRITPLCVVGMLRARRGDPDAWETLDHARDLARSTGELQRVGAAASARAEARWLAGDDELVREETDDALRLALARGDIWMIGELCVWRRRAGIDDALALGDRAEPFRLELEGDWKGAERAWRTLGCPYEAALALASADAEEPVRRGLEELQRLGAQGLRNGEIANQLFVSEKTVGHHVSAILRKLDVRTRGQAASAAARLGIGEK
jgi:hypothetical protein